MNTNIDSVVKRGRGYWFVDGFVEMIAGGLLVLLGAVLFVRGIASQDSLLAGLTQLTVDVAIVKAIGLAVAILLIWFLKDRFTYPRTGYVKGKKIPASQFFAFARNVILILLLPVLALVAAFLLVPAVRAALFSMPAWLPAGIGTLWAAICIVSGEWMGLRRFRLLGALILVAGAAICAWQLGSSLSQASMQAAVYRTFLGIGLLGLVSGKILVISGLVVFLRYRKENPLPYEEQA